MVYYLLEDDLASCMNRRLLSTSFIEEYTMSAYLQVTDVPGMNTIMLCHYDLLHDFPLAVGSPDTSIRLSLPKTIREEMPEMPAFSLPVSHSKAQYKCQYRRSNGRRILS
jgi:hypothetical protein